MADGGDTVSNGGDDVLGIEYEGTGNGDTSVTEITEEDAGLAIGELESRNGLGNNLISKIPKAMGELNPEQTEEPSALQSFGATGGIESGTD